MNNNVLITNGVNKNYQILGLLKKKRFKTFIRMCVKNETKVLFIQKLCSNQ